MDQRNYFEELVHSIAQDLAYYREQGHKLFATSSFQTQSVVLLHIISQIDKSIPIVFINTGYHFAETLIYRDKLTKMLGLNVVDLFSSVPKSFQRDASGRLLYASNPDYCCHLNKVEPMEVVMRSYSLWINGVRKSQSDVRAKFAKEQEGKYGVLRYHPILDWTAKMVYDYRKLYNLPQHPLEAQGYLSIGCEPCTQKIDLNNSTIDNRSGRWAGLNKTECGLHTDLASPNKSK